MYTQPTHLSPPALPFISKNNVFTGEFLSEAHLVYLEAVLVAQTTRGSSSVRECMM